MDTNFNFRLTENPFVTAKPLNATPIQSPEESTETPQQFNISDDQYDGLTSDGKAIYIKDFLSNDDFIKSCKNPMAVMSAICGVWSNESALKRTSENKMELKKWTGENAYKAGRGIAQWSLGRNTKYREWSLMQTGTAKYASEDSIDNQLKFALLEMKERPALMKALASAETPEQAADAWRRGFENGSKNALASAKYMDSYEKVGSPGAKAIYNKDTKKANYFFDLFTGNGLLDRANQKMRENGNIWRQS